MTNIPLSISYVPGTNHVTWMENSKSLGHRSISQEVMRQSQGSQKQINEEAEAPCKTHKENDFLKTPFLLSISVQVLTVSVD